jgi:hypothetical protein
MTNNVLGAGQITIVGVQTGSEFVGDFSAFYPGVPVIEGRVVGNVRGYAITGQMIPRANACPGAFSGTVTGNRIDSTWTSPSCSPPQFGTLVVDKISDDLL